MIYLAVAEWTLSLRHRHTLRQISQMLILSFSDCLLHAHQHGSDRPAEKILSAEGIVELTGDERNPIVCFGLEYRVHIVGFDQFAFAHFVGVGLTPGLDLNLVAVLQRFQLCEDAGVIVGIPNMTGDDGIACPGWEGGASQVACVVAEPAYIPAIFRLRYTDDGHAHTQLGDFEQHRCVGVGFGGRLLGNLRYASMPEACCG